MASSDEDLVPSGRSESGGPIGDGVRETLGERTEQEEHSGPVAEHSGSVEEHSGSVAFTRYEKSDGRTLILYTHERLPRDLSTPGAASTMRGEKDEGKVQQT